MQARIRNPLKLLQVLAGALALTLVPATARAQELQASPPALEQPQAVPPLDENTIRVEATLQVPVTFEAKRQKLPEVLAALQAQSGVTLSVGPDSPLAAKLLTARAKAMPLAHVLGSLCRLYGAAWVRQGEAFEMRSNGRSTLDNAMWKLWYTKYNALRDALANPIDWNQEAENLGANRLQQKDGVAFEELPEDIKQQLRAQLETQDVAKLAIALDAARLPNLEGSTVEVRSELSLTGTVLMLTIIGPDGKLLSTRNITVAPAAR